MGKLLEDKDWYISKFCFRVFWCSRLIKVESYLQGLTSDLPRREGRGHLYKQVLRFLGKLGRAESFSCICFISIAFQFSLVSQSSPTLCEPMNPSMPGLLVHHQLLEFTQTHVHRVSDAIQQSHPLSSLFPPAPNPSQHQSLFQ